MRHAPIEMTNHRFRISWQGGLFVNTSLAHVNREFSLQLLIKGHTISFTPTEPDELSQADDPRFNPLKKIRNLPLEKIDVTIRHQWPPNFIPPPRGKLVLIQPWEFGSIPKEWVTPIRNQVDEVWAYTSYVRDCYIKSGVAPEKVWIVPLGVNTTAFAPDTPPLKIKTNKRFRFLFVGGTIHRKGIDLLLAAFHHSFTAADDVCLVIKDMGGATVYQGQTARETIERFQQSPGAPEIEYIDRTLTTEEMAGLYTACHCLVHPYRGEGFGLPIAEAMACGLTPIVTGYGAALDFCTQDNAWLIPATIEKLPLKKIGNRETVDLPWLAEPNFKDLCDFMRHAASHPEEVAQRGKIACQHIRDHFTWEHAARIADERIQSLAKQSDNATPNSSDSHKETALRTNLAGEACKNARVLAQRGDLDGAVSTLLNQGIKSAPDSPFPYFELSETLIAAGRHQEALQVLPEMPHTSNRQLVNEIAAICHAALGNDEAAWRAALHSDGRPRSMVVLGTLSARRGDMAKAESFFRCAIAVDPSCGSAWLSLGMLLWGQNMQEDAWQAVYRSVAADPLNREAVAILLDMSQRCKHLVDALEIITNASHAYPDSRNLARTHADLLSRCDNDAQALKVSEDFLVRFGVEENLLSLALDLRKRLGPHDLCTKGVKKSVSLCMIVKNEVQHLARCLASARPVVHEMIVVDTGSSDRTVDIATAFGARVYRFAWNGDFSAARNFAIERATGDWILVLDADEVLSARDYATISKTARSSGGTACAWSVLTRNYTAKVNSQGWTANDGTFPSEESADGWYPSWKVRLFPRQPGIRFSGDVHEMVEASLRQSDVLIKKASFVVHHYGELEPNGKNREKQLRYFESGMKKLEQDPDDMAAIAELAVQAGELGRFEEAVQLWDRVLARVPDAVEGLFNKGYCLMGLKRYEEALIVSRRALELDPEHKEAAFNYGTCELYTGHPARALALIGPVADRNPDYPLLQAILTVLLLAEKQQLQASLRIEELQRMDYAIRQYITERVERLKELGFFERAEIICQTMFPIFRNDTGMLI